MSVRLTNMQLIDLCHDMLEIIICDHIFKLHDIAAVELVCKLFYKISRNRTRLTNRTRILSPDILDVFPNLLTVNGCFNNIQPLLKSKLRRFDYLLMPIPASNVLYMPSLVINDILKSYAALTFKPDIKIYSYFARSLIYSLSANKVVQFCHGHLSDNFIIDVRKYVGQEVQIELHLSSSDIRLLKHDIITKADHIVLYHSPECVISDDQANHCIKAHIVLLSKAKKATIVTTLWWAMRYRAAGNDKISIITPMIESRDFPITSSPCQSCAVFPCENCGMCPGMDCQACRCSVSLTDIFDETLIQENDQPLTCNPPILKWLADWLGLDRLSPA